MGSTNPHRLRIVGIVQFALDLGDLVLLHDQEIRVELTLATLEQHGNPAHYVLALLRDTSDRRRTGIHIEVGDGFDKLQGIERRDEIFGNAATREPSCAGRTGAGPPWPVGSVGADPGGDGQHVVRGAAP